MAKTRIGFGAVVLALMLSWSGTASAQDAKMYELTENMSRVMHKHQLRRDAVSQLMGFAKAGTPLCPVGDSQYVVPQETVECTFNATGVDSVSYSTGHGAMNGRFEVVVQGDNPVDGPELVVMTGTFSGQMDFSPALLHNMPYGTVTGRLRTRKQDTLPFTGTFRLPFLASYSGPETGGQTLRQLFCPLSPTPNPNLFGSDIAYIDTTAGVPNGKCIDVRPDELALGYPTVRFDIQF